MEDVRGRMAAAAWKKLRVKAGSKVLLMTSQGPRPVGLDPGPDDVTVLTEPGLQVDVALAFFTDLAAVRSSLDELKASIGESGTLWICYPKGGSKVATDLNRDVLRLGLEEDGLKGVSLVSIDDVWSALRFKPVPGG